MTEDQLKKGEEIKKKINNIETVLDDMKVAKGIDPEKIAEVQITFAPRGSFFFHPDNHLYEEHKELIKDIQRVASVYVEVITAMLKKRIEELNHEFENL